MCLDSRNKGTFYIDPKIPSVGFDARGDKARKKNPPHASFRARNAPISLDLGTTGDANVAFPRANVLVSTRHGNVNVKLLPTSSLRPALSLEVITRGGNILVFVPKDFAGAIQISSHKGRIEFLEAFASEMRVMKQSQNDALVMLGGQSGEIRDMNFCELKSRSGKIIVGLGDIDTYDVKSGFWQKLFGSS
ncbi:hypothetical protein DXG01_003320 [Tephrocybe rancida]|nr:hypothetical protein DXG01_003320 [Tephrocybe rancida]